MSPYKLAAFFSVPALILTGVAFAATPSSSAALPSSSADRVTVLETKMALRDLWGEHVFWIRSYVLATHAHDESQSKTAETEVVANANALANSIAPFYGQSAADGLFKLLAGHWGAVRDYNTATLAGSKAGQDKAVVNLTGNAREIAKFLSAANPNLPEDVVFSLMAAHGGHHVAQINEVATHDFKAEAATWQTMRQHMYVISDAIVDALAKHFPGRFQAKA